MTARPGKSSARALADLIAIAVLAYLVLTNKISDPVLEIPAVLAGAYLLGRLGWPRNRLARFRITRWMMAVAMAALVPVSVATLAAVTGTIPPSDTVVAWSLAGFFVLGLVFFGRFLPSE